MANRNYNKIIEMWCQSVDCRKPLTEYEINRQKLFISIRDIDLLDDDIYFINELNNSSILLFNIINGFGRIYHTYLIHMISSEYSLEQYSLDMENLLRLEKKYSLFK